MVSERQTEMIAKAYEHFEKEAKEAAERKGEELEGNVYPTPRQLFRWIDSNYKRHGFKSEMAVAHALKRLRRKG